MIQKRYNTAIIVAAVVFAIGAVMSLLFPLAGVAVAASGLLTGISQTLNMNLAVIREAKAEGLKLRLWTWAIQYFGCVALALAAWVALGWRVMA